MIKQLEQSYAVRDKQDVLAMRAFAVVDSCIITAT
jgi:hypothetical protein